MTATTISTETVPQAPAPGTKTNGTLGKYNPRNYLSDRAKVTEIDGIRGLMACEGPGVVSFLAGRPNPDTFPFNSITLNLKPPLGLPESSNNMPVSITIEDPDLAIALQYAPSAGIPKLREWLADLQAHVHERPRGDYAISVGSGSQDLMFKGFQAVLNPGDPVLLETPMYAGVLPALRILKADYAEVDVDDQGLSAKNLEKVLSEWPADKKRPRVLYTSPIGSNPSGCSASKERKLEVLKVCKKYDVLIFEDDPYYYLAQELIPSYFALEKQVYPEGGHVVRFDSFSKLLSAGMRLGFATGPKEILHAIDVSTAGANLHTSAVSQGVALRLMQYWGIEGFLAHGRAVAKLYTDRRAQFEATAHKYLDGLASWVSPVAGMFLWIDLRPAGIEDSYELIRHEALAKGVLGVPGMAFYPTGRKSSHVRVSFSIVDLGDESDLGFQRLAEAIKDKRKALGLA
ncbi:tryptophan aminotransferase [Cryptococcus gattii Ru294]|uniref:Aromatic amino acid transaminase, putative n=2 Tax=Cryptococcus gattii TaxID=37769 RepID=E6R8D9_CRYGW|nr:Aromatic amino acid transaminase, putative [Cryptococcus gattii WM276]KIR52616.1 tryptophan aminotransferase [Cryptococcus gattii Ru294]KIR82501.1 tryptophan aminotransferase [Cryptococcus gattii EJB2]KIY33824.1 tryptophan aminotransferase [Cryptococcus gattii E566]KJE04180.1 tryptophan aminotransferase [Cryptococcus gattii NT-10]ADV23053.1 Aromatic amino acid transaminase, putative [Cryptococcus gattii WM276]